MNVTVPRITGLSNLNSDRPCPEISEAILTLFLLPCPFFRLLFCGYTSENRPVVAPVVAPSLTDLRLDGMSRTVYNQVLPYTRPVGVSDEDAARAVYLRSLRASSYRREERDSQRSKGELIDTLQDLAAIVDKKNKTQERFAPPAKQKNLRNVEFLIAMIMDDEGRSDAVPPVWRVPVELPTKRKRGSVTAALPAPSIDGSARPEITAADTHPAIHGISR